MVSSKKWNLQNIWLFGASDLLLCRRKHTLLEVLALWLAIQLISCHPMTLFFNVYFFLDGDLLTCHRSHALFFFQYAFFAFTLQRVGRPHHDGAAGRAPARSFHGQSESSPCAIYPSCTLSLQILHTCQGSKTNLTIALHFVCHAVF